LAVFIDENKKDTDSAKKTAYKTQDFIKPDIGSFDDSTVFGSQHTYHSIEIIICGGVVTGEGKIIHWLRDQESSLGFLISPWEYTFVCGDLIILKIDVSCQELIFC
jgi:hypothetical protein